MNFQVRTVVSDIDNFPRTNSWYDMNDILWHTPLSNNMDCSEIYWTHYTDVIMSAMASQITSIAIVYSSVFSCTDQRKHQRSASMAFVREMHRWPVNSPHKGPATRKILPSDDVIMIIWFVCEIFLMKCVPVHRLELWGSACDCVVTNSSRRERWRLSRNSHPTCSVI